MGACTCKQGREGQTVVEYRRIELDNVKYYGKHLILTGLSCRESITDKQSVADFLKTLVKKIDMVAFGEPLVERFGNGIEIGLSAVQLIETSAIVVHTNDQARDMYLDVFSCKGFSEEVVVDYVREIFQPQQLNFQVLLR